MEVVMGAQSFGFGPVSKLLSISQLIDAENKVFVGDGIALSFVNHNPQFQELRQHRATNMTDMKLVIEECDMGIVVMDNTLAFMITRAQRPLYFFDSLFAFWVLRSDLKDLVEISERIRTLDNQRAFDLFRSVPVHEQMILCHLLAKRSFIQNFVGVEERVEQLRQLRVDHLVVTGPILSASSVLLETEVDDIPPPDSPEGWTMLVNLGGVRNFIVDIDENDDYVKMIENWALEFLRSSPGCRQITICSGLYSHQADNVSIDGRILRRCQLAHSTFVQHLRQADVYVTSPGLTALNEAIHVGKLPVLLPEQHFGQYYNLEQLRNTRLGNLSVRNSDLFSNYAITNDDYKGSLDVLKYIRRLREEEECRKRLHTILHQRITTVRNSSTEFRQAAIDEIKQLTQGADLKTVVTQILDDIRLGQ